MREELSRLVDGDLEEARLPNMCNQLHDDPEIAATWVSYHIIGECLRDSCYLAPGFSARLNAKLAEEPTILAPKPSPAKNKSNWATWAAAASLAAVSVWLVLQTTDPNPPAVASLVADSKSARQSAAISEYLLVHQEYSPTTAIQGVRPYIRAVSTTNQEAKP